MRSISLCLVLFAAACEKHDSVDILTSGINAQIVVEAEGDGTTQARASLFLGSPGSLDFIELQGDDRLVAVVDQDAREMTEFDFLNIVSYQATFDTDAPDTLFDVQFIRTIDLGAPSSTCTLPAGFDLTTSAEGLEVSRAAEIVVDWAPSGELDDMRYEIKGICLQDVVDVIQNDTGGIILVADTLVKAEGDGVEDSCQATFTMWRTRGGDLDPGYGEGGTIECRQVRSFTFTSIP
jgi:hypothetical protein